MVLILSVLECETGAKTCFMSHIEQVVSVCGEAGELQVDEW
jgi:hypothetical protein